MSSFVMIDMTMPWQPEEQQRPALMKEPSEPAMKALARLEYEDPKLALYAARIVGLYRRLWESCASKHLEGERLEKENSEGGSQKC
jgi:hypothetical protein